MFRNFFLNWFHLDFCFLGALYDSSWCPHRMLFLRIWISPQVGVLSQLFWLWFKIHSFFLLRNSCTYLYGIDCWNNIIHLDSWKQNFKVLEKNWNLLDFTKRYAYATFITSYVLRNINTKIFKIDHNFRWWQYDDFNNEHNDDARQLGGPAHAKRRWVWPWPACWISLSVLQQCTIETFTMTETIIT